MLLLADEQDDMSLGSEDYTQTSNLPQSAWERVDDLVGDLADIVRALA